MPQASLSQYRRKPHLLFVGKDDSTLTQMAEAYIHKLGKGIVEVKSAGMEAVPIHPHTIKAMDEDHVDIRHQQAKLINAELLTWADLIIIVASDPDKLHVAIPKSAHHKNWVIDPPDVSTASATTMTTFRQCRDEIKQRVHSMVNTMHLFKTG